MAAVILSNNGGGGSTTINIPIATQDSLGGIKVGTGLNIASDGTLNANYSEQIQSDWNQTDEAQASYIQNKPINLVSDANYVHTDNNYTGSEKQIVGLIVKTGDGTKILADDGLYKNFNTASVLFSLAELTGFNNNTTVYDYTSDSKINSITEKDDKGNTVRLESYMYDSNGRISSCTITMSGQTVTTTYTYDENNRVISATNVLS